MSAAGSGAEAPAPFPRAALQGSIPARFLAIARAHPARTAVEDGDRRLSYERLDALAGAVAGILGAAPAGRPAGVALLFPQGAELIVATLGALESGHLVVPLAPQMAVDACRERIARVGARAVLTTPALEAEARRAARGACPVHVIGLSLAPAAPDRHRPSIAPAAPACVYFTSGTTGPSRGVVDLHRNVLHNVLRYTSALAFGPEDRMTVVQTPTFSGVMSSTFGALLNGATLLPFDLAREGAGPPLVRWLARVRPTVYHSVPSIFRSICSGDAMFPSVRVVRLEGDVAAPRDVELFRAHFRPDAVLANGLGATETGLVAQHRVQADDPVPERILPVGRPVIDMEIEIRDPQGRVVPQGRPGEICVRSAWLAAGYWDDPALTADRFDDVDGAPGQRRYRTGDAGRIDTQGRLEHLGRLDHQIKIQGEWVDLPAIERACESAPGVAAAAVVAERDDEGEIGLAACLVPCDGATPEWRSVMAHLIARLPVLACPARLWLVDELPTTPDGKLDRARLSRLEARRLVPGDTIAAPRDPLETELAEIWRSVIDLPRIGIRDRWSDLGGTSLGAARVLAMIEESFGVSLTLADFMEAHTIAELAALVRAARPAQAQRMLVRVQTGGRAPALFCVQDLESDAFLFAALARRLGADQPLYALRFPPGGPAADVPCGMRELAARGVAEIRAVQPRGPYRLAGFCYGAVVALEMAHALTAAGEAVERLALLNVTPHDLPDLVSTDALRRFRRRPWARLVYLARKRGRAAWLARRLARSLRDRIAAWRDIGHPTTPAHAGDADAEFVRARLLHAFRQHRSRPFTGPVFVAPAAENLFLYADDAAPAWRPLSEPAPHVAVQSRDGYAMLVEPDVGDLAAALSAWLERGRGPEAR